MLSEHRALRVFLCHAHSDKNAVWDLYLRLIGDGIDAWLDKEKLLPGQDWEHEIRKAVRESDVVVVCLSKQFNEAGFRQKEVRLALETAMEKPEGEIFIIPARLEECDTLESLRRWHMVDLFEDDGYDRILAALRARANKIGAPLQGDQPDQKQRKRLEILNKEAIRYELQGDLWRALQTYYSIRRIDPAFQRVDMKIEQLERELREAKTLPYVTPKPLSTFSWGTCLGIALLLAVIGLSIYASIMTFVVVPTPTLTNTPPALTLTLTSSNPTLTFTPIVIAPTTAFPTSIPILTFTPIVIAPTTAIPTSIPTSNSCQVPTATHRLRLSEYNNYFWIDARRECATSYSGDRPNDCNDLPAVLLGAFKGAEILVYSNDTLVAVPDERSRPPWPIKFFWKVSPNFFENANGHFTEAPNPSWLVLNEPNTNQSTQPSTSVSFLQGVKDAEFQEECSAEGYEIISVIGYINTPNLHSIVEKLP